MILIYMLIIFEYTLKFVIVSIFSEDIDLPKGLDVYVKDHDCGDPVEKLFYSCDYHPCCIQCGEYLKGYDEQEEFYPQ